MNHRKRWLLGGVRGTAVVGALTAAVLVGLAATNPTSGPGGGHALWGRAAEQATPDSETDLSDVQPGRQRVHQLARLGMDRWHAAGIRGKGIKIAILDTGFRGYLAHLGKALPQKVTTRSFRADGDLEAKNSQHGILCGEVLHALAPDAELLLANWDTESPERFLEAARWAREQGARVISCSVIMPHWSDGDGGGYVNQTLAGILGRGNRAGDLLCFASAGNTAQRHWTGRFRDAGGLHEWVPERTSNAVKPWGGERVSIELYWPAGDDRFEMVVTDHHGESIGKATAHHGRDRNSATVHFMPSEGRRYQVQVRSPRPAQAGSFHLVVLGGGLEFAQARGSIACPADNPAVLAVGAVHDNDRRASYSSCGPNSARPKPDLMAPVPYPSQWRAKPFTGTSAAAPQAAALAAVLWSRHPDWTAQEVRDALQASARDLGPPGHDHETGYGVIALPNLGKR